MPDNSESNIATADALTLLLRNQHTAAVEEFAVWLLANGVEAVADNAVMAMETLKPMQKVLSDAITRLRGLQEIDFFNETIS